MEPEYGAGSLETDELRRLGHAVVDLFVDIVRAESQDPVLPAVTGQAMRSALAGPPPRAGRPFEDILGDVRDVLVPGCRKNGHPRFFGYVCASADPLGALFDALASVLNQNVTAWRSAPAMVELERLVVRWMGQLVGFGEDAHGLLTSGGSSANATAIAVALHRAGGGARSVVYVSQEGHLSLAKASRVFAVEHVRTVAVDAERRMVPGQLARAIREDRERGLFPACVCASAGTANTGAIDPLAEIASVCAEQAVWLHVDGAYGAPAAMTEAYAFLREALARVDSLSLDPHKWFFAPLDVGCLLMRDPHASHGAFTLQSEYVAVTQTDEIEAFAFFDHGLELSRRARALKVWGILSARGTDAVTAEIERNIALREHLDARIEREPDLEALGSGLSISCFRWRPPGADEVVVDRTNRKILDGLVASGRFLMSPTTLSGKFALRVCVVNFRTTAGDLDELLDEVLRLGAGPSPGC